jgi:hypothetical protein
MIKSLFPLGLLLTITSFSFAQTMVLVDPVSSRVFSTEKYSGYNGSPFLLNDNWTPGSATVPKGTYKDLELRLDVYNSVLYFKRNEEPYEFQDEVMSFVLMPNVSDTTTWMRFKKGFADGGLKPQQYVQVLVEGKVSLYKSELKLLSEVNQVNQGVVKTFSTTVRYFILKNGAMQLIKLNKSDILELLKDQEAKVKQFIDELKISFKKDKDVARLLAYYNSL